MHCVDVSKVVPQNPVKHNDDSGGGGIIESGGVGGEILGGVGAGGTVGTV